MRVSSPACQSLELQGLAGDAGEVGWLYKPQIFQKTTFLFLYISALLKIYILFFNFSNVRDISPSSPSSPSSSLKSIG
jgi:hypothetical protein